MFSLTCKIISYPGANMNKVHYENKMIYLAIQKRSRHSEIQLAN